jgi:chromosome segregation ATPase
MEEQLANAQERLEQERARAQQLEKDVTQLREQLDAARMQHQAQLKGLQEQLEHEHAHAARLEEELQKLEKERNESRMRGEDKSASKDEKKRQKKQSKKHSALAPAPPAGGEATTPVVPTFPPALLADFQREREAAKTELQQAREQLSQEQAVAQQRLEQAEKDRIEANQRLEKEIAQRDAAERAREEAEEARRQLGVLLEKERQEHASLRQQHASLTEQARSLQLQAQENALKLQTAEDRLRELQLELEKVRKQREDAPPPPPTFPQELIEKHKTDIRELQEQLATERALAISLKERLDQVARARTQEVRAVDTCLHEIVVADVHATHTTTHLSLQRRSDRQHPTLPPSPPKAMIALLRFFFFVISSDWTLGASTRTGEARPRISDGGVRARAGSQDSSRDSTCGGIESAGGCA